MKGGVYLWVMLQWTPHVLARSNNDKPLQHPVSAVKVIDLRADTGMLSLTPTANLAKFYTYLNPDSLYSFIVRSYIDHSQGRDKAIAAPELIVRLHTFYVTETRESGVMKEQAKFRLDADFFISERPDKFIFLGRRDITVSYTGIAIVEKFMQTFEESLCKLYDQLYQSPRQWQVYSSYDEVVNYDDNKKKLLPAYTMPIADNAVYYTWDDFLMLKKQENQSVQLTDKKKFKIEYKNDRGKTKHAPVSNVHMFACNGKLYYNVEGVPCEMTRKGNDFFVRGTIGKEALKESLESRGFIVVIVTGKGLHTYDFRIDYRNGELVPIREI
jgi:hypothetical protein